ncbi:MAG: hypothetical protein MEQ74_01290 [Paracoccus sp.]|nr:hypothetical protein [Paracoccus sp. (in: a-proteobacteria)]
MKTLLTAAALFSMTAIPALAATGMNERPELTKPDRMVQTVERRAGDLYETRDLARRGLSADDRVTVTALPRSGRAVDYSSSNGG